MTGQLPLTEHGTRHPSLCTKKSRQHKKFPKILPHLAEHLPDPDIDFLNSLDGCAPVWGAIQISLKKPARPRHIPTKPARPRKKPSDYLWFVDSSERESVSLSEIRTSHCFLVSYRPGRQHTEIITLPLEVGFAKDTSNDQIILVSV